MPAYDVKILTSLSRSKKIAMNAALEDEASRKACFLCYITHQQQRSVRQKLIAPKNLKQCYMPGNMPKGIKLHRKGKSQDPRHSTPDGARRAAIKKQRDWDRQCAAAARLALAYSPLCPIQEDDDEDKEGASQMPDALSPFDNLHVCGHLYYFAEADIDGPYAEVAVRTLESCTFYHTKSLLAIRKWLDEGGRLPGEPENVIKKDGN